MTPKVASAESSSWIETTAAMWSPDGRRKSPKVAVIAVTRHQLTDPAASLSGFLARGAITRYESAVSSIGETLVEQCSKRGQRISDGVGICGRGAGEQRAA